jgi:hypothetical protein
MAELVSELTGVDRETALKALEEHKEVWLAVDALMKKPVVSGEKYIPAKPKTNTGMTPEQEELCMRGRWLQDKVNAVFSVAHSQTLARPDASPPALEDAPAQTAEMPVAAESSASHVQQDTDEKMIQSCP